MNYKIPFFVLFVLFGLIKPLQAGGSIVYSDVRPLLPPGVRQHLEKSFKIADVGGATRLGRHFTNLGGSRIGPFNFDATSNFDPGLRVQLTIQMDTQFLDGSGQPSAQPEGAVQLLQTFESYEVRLATSGSGLPGGGSGLPGSGLPGAGSGLPGSGSGLPGPPAPLTAQQKQQVVENVRRVYGEVEALKLAWQKHDFESEDGLSGSLSSGKSSNVVRKIKLEAAAGDHGGFEAELFYDNQQRLSFVLWTDSYWRFDTNNPNQTIDFVKEHRFYYSSAGVLAKALRKSYQGNSEKSLLTNRDKAVNQEIKGDPTGVFEFYKNASNLAFPGHLSNPGRSVEDLVGTWQTLNGQ